MDNTKTNKNLNIAVKYSGFKTLKEALDAHRAWVFGEAGGKCANLGGTNLSGANLSGANLSGAYLRGANLSDTDLSGVNFSRANLSRTDLSGADLRGTDLEYANLRCANLSNVKLESAKLEKDLSWERYLSEVVPALCIAGGKSLEEVAEVWECHSWENCPMHIAFGVNSLKEVPAIYQFEAQRFVRFFDQKLIPNPIMTLGVK